MAFSKAKIASMASKGFLVAGDLLFTGVLKKSVSGGVDDNGYPIAPTVTSYACKVLKNGVSDGKNNSDIINPTDLVVYVQGLGVEVSNVDILEFDGRKYIILIPDDQSAGTGQLYKMTVRPKT